MKIIYNTTRYEAVEDLMADSGEQSDGELPARTRQNLAEAGFAENEDVRGKYLLLNTRGVNRIRCKILKRVDVKFSIRCKIQANS
jgi:hypothetical protein